jgi:LCP family protein required for cell wall assembly
VARHRNAELDESGPDTALYRPQQTELRTRRAPVPPLWARLCVFAGALLLTGSIVAYTASLLLGDADATASVKRSNLLPAPQAAEAHVDGPLNLLIIGRDTKSEAEADESRAAADGGPNTITLMHVSPELDRAYGIDFPWGASVEIPPLAGKWEGGEDGLGRAYELGGAPHLVKTIQELSGLSIDHVLVADFAGLRKVTDAVGGVDLYVSADTRGAGKDLRKGVHRLNGEAAEAYVCPRARDAAGDVDPGLRRQQFLHALLAKVSKPGTLSGSRAEALRQALAETVTVDQSMPVRDVVSALQQVKPADLAFLSLPMVGAEDGPTALIDEVTSRELFDAVKSDTVDVYVFKHPPHATAPS